MKKRIIAMLLASVMVISCLAGCSGQSAEQGTTQTQEASQAQTTETKAAETKKAETSKEPVTITILTRRHDESTNDVKDVWFFKYLEYWLAQQGYNVKIDVNQTSEVDTQISLLCATDTLPDLVWGIELSNDKVSVYGSSEHMLLDWTPYLNEETMPNLMKIWDNGANAASLCTDGAIYGLPYIRRNLSWKTPYASFGMTDRMFVNTKWLEEFNLSVPTTIDEYLDMLRAFKNKKLESGEEVVPLSSAANFLQKWIWSGLGFYGTNEANGVETGIEIAIRDNQITLPAYSEQYREFVQLMKTLYDEGLISPDFFTMDDTTAQGIMSAGRCGVLADWTLENTPADHVTEWQSVPMIKIGDNDQIAISLSKTYTPNSIWASAKTENAEIITKIVDYLYSKEGTILYHYGPKKGEDPLGIQEGWYLDEKGNVTCDKVQNGTYTSMTYFGRQEIYSYDNTGTNASKIDIWDETGFDGNSDVYKVKDSITGEEFDSEYFHAYDDLTSANGWWRETNVSTSQQYVTRIALPQVYFNEEEAMKAVELKTILAPYIENETAKFITGLRPIEEIDEYFNEIKDLGADEYLELYKNAYSTYIQNTFNK